MSESLSLQIERAHQVPGMIDEKTYTFRHILLKFPNSKGKKNNVPCFKDRKSYLQKKRSKTLRILLIGQVDN